MATTIRDIANATRVSPATVSRVLRGDTRNGFGVSDETRRRIVTAAEAMDYQANAAASAMASGRTGLIGVAINELTATFLETILEGIQSYAARHDLTLVLYSELCGEVNRSEIQLLRAIRSRQVDGVLLVHYYKSTEKLIQTLGEERIPFVALSPQSMPGKAAVHVDDEEGGRLAGEHLLSLGHRHISFVGSSQSYSEARWRGLEKAVVAAGCVPRYALWPEVPGLITQRLEHAGQRCETLLAQHPETTGIACSEDSFAVAVNRAARKLGRRIPEDLSVVGYDNMYWTEFLDTPLTTIQQPKELQGNRAMELLQELIDGGEPREIWMKPELVIRQSTGAPA